MKRFASLYDALDASTSTRAKVEAMRAYFALTPPEDAAWAVYVLAGGKLRQAAPSRLLRETGARVAGLPDGTGFDARAGRFCDLFASGIIDPVKVTRLALENAVSVAKLILTTHTLIADLPDDGDPTAGPARGGGAETFGRR